MSFGQLHSQLLRMGQNTLPELRRLKTRFWRFASIRDYDELLNQRPAVQPPAFYGGQGARRIVHQVWDWIEETKYIVHLYITQQSNDAWTAHHFVSEYRCILRGDLSTELESVGFRDVQWLMPKESCYFQPIVLARWG